MTVENLFHIYVSSLSGGRIDLFNLNADTGEMSRKQTVGLSGKGLPLAVSPDRRRLYASVIGEVDGEEEPHPLAEIQRANIMPDAFEDEPCRTEL